MVSIVVLIFRAATALLQAQNQVETRMKSTNCDGRASSQHLIQLLVEVDPADRHNLTVKYIPGDDIVEPWSDSTGLWQECSFESGQVELLRETSRYRSLALYNCRNLELKLGSDTMAAFYLELRRSNTQLASIPFPYIWLSNGKEQEENTGLRLTHAQAVRSYLPVWELRPGFHIEAEARLVTRRIIKSSLWRDTILSTEPTYNTLSLYPIFNLGLSNYSSKNVASARISTRLKPGFVYFRDRVTPPYHAPSDVCDFIEDYRSGTIFDVIGSVGGLFALLQGINVFLFGRPLFWGLTGAKLISPFGLLGEFSSKSFKRRLGEQYHRRSAEDNSIKIRTGAFLRDFVVDFGPADFHPEQHSACHSPTSGLKQQEESGDLIPLMQMGSDSASHSTPQEDNNPDISDRATIRSGDRASEASAA